MISTKKRRITGFSVILIQLIVIFFLVTKESQNTPFFSSASQEDTYVETPYLHVEEVVHVTETNEKDERIDVVLPIQKVLFEYVEVTGGCGPHFEGECLRVRSGPGTEFPVVSRLRNGMVFKISGKVERAGEAWYKIVFDEWLRYPERLTSDWYVSADYVEVLLDEGKKVISDTTAEVPVNNKRIIVDRSDQTLTAYEGDELFMTTNISTGLALTPTPRGTFHVYKKTPSRYMQGPLPYLNDKQYYDLPGVPWNLYFTEGGAVIHGAYWHESFGTPYSHGCVNLSPETARTLYKWAELNTSVIVQD